MSTSGLLAASIGAVILSACAPCCTVVQETGHPPFQAQKFQAVGYGAMGGSNSAHTVGQQKLMAIRAATVDAYRNIAEQVYGFRVWGNTAVSAFSTQNDSVRTYVDATLRGAHVVNMTAIADGNFEVTVELELKPAFFSCLYNFSTCNVPVAVGRENYCGYAPCVQPSAYYYTREYFPR